MISGMKRSCVAATFAMGVLATIACAAGKCQNPYFQVAPGTAMQQYAYSTMGRAYSGMPGYGFAYPGMARAGALGPYGMGANPYGLPGAGMNPYLGAAALQNNPYLGAATMSSSSPGYGSPGAGYNPYYSQYPYYYQDPFNGYLTGGAAVISAQSQFMLAKQQANLLYEQVRQARLDTHRKAIDQYLYEREKLPTPEQDRERSRLQERDRSLNSPPLTEIWSAKALNDLLTDLQRLRAKGSLATYRGPQVPVEEDELARINVTSSKTGTGNIGLLKNDGRISWPIALNTAELKEERDRVSSLAQEAVKQASFNTPVDAGTLKQMGTDLEKLNKFLVGNVGNLPPSQYIDAKRFLSDFDDALKALRQPDVGKYFTKKVKAKNVAELVDYMTSQGLQFAAAVPGDETAYVALHRALATYDVAVQNQVAEAR